MFVCLTSLSSHMEYVCYIMRALEQSENIHLLYKFGLKLRIWVELYSQHYAYESLGVVTTLSSHSQSLENGGRGTLSLKGGGRRMENRENFLCGGFTAKLILFTW